MMKKLWMAAVIAGIVLVLSACGGNGDMNDKVPMSGNMTDSGGMTDDAMKDDMKSDDMMTDDAMKDDMKSDDMMNTK